MRVMEFFQRNKYFICVFIFSLCANFQILFRFGRYEVCTDTLSFIHWECKLSVTHTVSSHIKPKNMSPYHWIRIGIALQIIRKRHICVYNERKKNYKIESLKQIKQKDQSNVLSCHMQCAFVCVCLCIVYSYWLYQTTETLDIIDSTTEFPLAELKY